MSLWRAYVGFMQALAVNLGAIAVPMALVLARPEVNGMPTLEAIDGFMLPAIGILLALAALLLFRTRDKARLAGRGAFYAVMVVSVGLAVAIPGSPMA